MNQGFILDHNSHIIVGDCTGFFEYIKPVLEKVIPADLWTSHPDVWQQKCEQFKVEDSRVLKYKNSSRPIVGPIKIFLIEIENITIEAQNALLKVLEEPQEDSFIFFIVNNPDIFLETVKSRCKIINITNQKGETGSVEAQIFLKASVVERVNFINDLHTKKELTKSFFFKFLVSLKKELETQPKTKQLGVVLEIEKYLYDKSFMPKMAMEYLAVSL